MTMMLGWKNWVDGEFTEATLTGGSYHASWPITNLRTRRLGEVARTANALTTSTVGIIDFGEARPFGMLTFTDSNLSAAATIRVRAAASEAALTSAPAFDTGAEAAWVSPNTPANTTNYKPTNIVLLAATQTYRYVRYDIADTGNAAGAVEIGHLGVWEMWAPPHQYDIGANSGIESYTGIDESVGQAEYFFVRGNGRSKRFGISFVTDDQADAFEDVQRYCDIHRPIFFLHDALQPTRWMRRSFLGRLRVLNQIEFPDPMWRGVGAEIKEWLA